ISDVHGNLEAFQAVLADIASHSVDEIYCLGDTTGYGPNPLECLDLTIGLHVVLLGNHDHAVLFGSDGFGSCAEGGILWSRSQLESAVEDPAVNHRHLHFLLNRPRSYREGNVLYVHASPRDPMNDYVFPEDIYNQRKMGKIGEDFKNCCFNGHTHIPGIFLEV